MKKLTALLLAVVMVVGLTACGGGADINAKSEGVMTHAEYIAADLEAAVAAAAFHANNK